ncbi:nicotinate-nucleotide diphosphorylase (carboxylating) [Sulfolobus sp. A20]|uniref:carboxylating nicotinate-nucleotide diphosphorylase n=1 Tax=Sulfolobaceae TaxID=118883 RepID=UPI000845F3EA|nr:MULTISPECIES: carboxylating nicotinate-nucleotide diphosphorylase [unclassified Sulfolobus]TRM75298.1 carboxylating nicotinate-nucleotide diphosphorylase [Sulfolobus sp. A20-N-F8]TRM76313.1 carboxylating nicotinate-nucleotide diphosphorylase [Sulfolobus sp. B5]TRM80533.1 carboxylating nicotinate-nucleotide diphosphorylase [Sulfolobus sp. D5]TRM81170.1 carboxylating nicotinate-nucleotide diphosphorylase [Sulfolobus sp. A20-N-F6]TRM87243.1 carboxylating nicotinate-nucleotide diphosphorylase [
MIEQVYIKRLLEYLEEDVLPEDITSSALEGIKAKGVVRVKERGVLAGNRFIVPFLNFLGFNVLNYKKDGEEIYSNQIVLEFSGDADKLLSIERLALNILSRLSGIATITNVMVKKAREVNPNVRIAGTRKTTPGFRIFEKYAIQVGGGDPHRYNLNDAVLIKDNHITLYGNLEELIQKIKRSVSFTKKIEVEVSSFENAIKAYKAGADAILLDNMKPYEIIPIVNELKGKVILEASGGINLDNIVDYAKSGVDVISSGYITHSYKSIDLSLDVERIWGKS